MQGTLGGVRSLPDGPIEDVARLHLHVGCITHVAGDDELLDEVADEGYLHLGEMDYQLNTQPDENAAAIAASLASASEYRNALGEGTDGSRGLTFITNPQLHGTAHNIAEGGVLIRVRGLGDDQ